MNIRDRVRELRRVPASQLQPNPRNWRTHPEAQQNVLRGVLAEVGMVGAVLARETAEGGLMLIDGHLRAEMLGNEDIPVLILDVNEAEADKLLATFDPLGAMAGADADALRVLLEEVETSSHELAEMLAALAEEHGIIPGEKGENDPDKEWTGLPEFENDEIHEVNLIVYFADADEKVRFGNMIQQAVNHDTKFVWHPKSARPVRQGVDSLVVEQNG